MKRLIISFFSYFYFLFAKIKSTICFKFGTTPKILTTRESINLLLNSKKSLSRFGDGEFTLINNMDIGFQNASISISNRLVEILQNKNENLIVGIPYSMIFNKHLKTEPQRYWSKYFSKNYYRIYSKLNLQTHYADSLLTRFFIDVNDKSVANENLTLLRKTWQSKKILIVEGAKSRMGVGNDLFDSALSLKRILVPSINAYDYYEEILSTVKIYADQIDLVILAIGPTATILASDLSRYGIRAFDLGHIDIEYEWMLSGCTQKVKIVNKSIGDLYLLDEPDNFYNQAYQESTVAIIGK